MLLRQWWFNYENEHSLEPQELKQFASHAQMLTMLILILMLMLISCSFS